MWDLGGRAKGSIDRVGAPRQGDSGLSRGGPSQAMWTRQSRVQVCTPYGLRGGGPSQAILIRQRCEVARCSLDWISAR